MAQHCFIKSLKLEDTNAMIWTNLGMFYLMKEEQLLAHECFKKSQAIDPEYSIAWIGQVKKIFFFNLFKKWRFLLKKYLLRKLQKKINSMFKFNHDRYEQKFK